MGLSKAGLAEGFALFSLEETFEWNSTSKHIGVCAAAAKRGAILVLTLRFYGLGRLDRWQCNRKRPDRTGGGGDRNHLRGLYGDRSIIDVQLLGSSNVSASISPRASSPQFSGMQVQATPAPQQPTIVDFAYP